MHNTFDYITQLSETQKAQKMVAEEKTELSFLCVEVHQDRLYIPIEQVKEIIPDPQITPIGHTKSWLEGILKAHGEIYSVVDIARFLESGTVNERSMHAIALSQTHVEGNYAVVVNNVLGIVKANSPKKLSSDTYKDVYEVAGEEKIDVLSIHNLVESPAFINVSVF